MDLRSTIGRNKQHLQTLWKLLFGGKIPSCSSSLRMTPSSIFLVDSSSIMEPNGSEEMDVIE